MNKQLDRLTNEERELLYKAPVLVSVLASSSLHELNEVQKADAIKLAHLKTFTSGVELRDYYQEVEKKFELQFDSIAEKYSPFDENKRNMLKKEIEKANLAIGKLEKTYGEMLHKSLEGYANHVKKAAHSVFQDFIFPFPIPGLSA